MSVPPFLSEIMPIIIVLISVGMPLWVNRINKLRKAEKIRSLKNQKRLAQDCLTLLNIEIEYGELLKVHTGSPNKNKVRELVNQFTGHKVSSDCNPAKLQRRIEHLNRCISDLNDEKSILTQLGA